jgi:hypothetical protein
MLLPMHKLISRLESDFVVKSQVSRKFINKLAREGRFTIYMDELHACADYGELCAFLLGQNLIKIKKE